jgi:hypothetical protein
MAPQKLTRYRTCHFDPVAIVEPKRGFLPDSLGESPHEIGKAHRPEAEGENPLIN